MRPPARRPALLLLCAALLGACASAPTIPPVKQVDLQRFMGDWYVIAHVPSWPERNAYNAVESYRLDEDGRIRTTFRYRDGSFTAPVKTMTPTGFVRPGTHNAVWGMQFVWPIRAEYVIVAVSSDYQSTIVARSDRDYAWIMARVPTLDGSEYRDSVEHLRRLGYDISKVRRVPHRWPEPPDPRP